MGRIMSFDQDGRRVRDFDKSEHDFLRRYGRTPEEVMDENAKLIVKLNAEHIVRQNVEVENAKLRELVVSYDSALHRMCDQMQGHVDCHDCILGKDYDNEDTCAIDELREAAYVVKVEFE